MSKKNSIQLSFHGTFSFKSPEVSLMTKTLKVSAENGEKVDKDKLMELTGLGNEKVLRVKSWAKRSGLTDGTRPTPEGQTILTHDPNLNHPATHWLIHLHLSHSDQSIQPIDNPSTLGGWSEFTFNFLPQHPQFTEADLIQHFSHTYPDDSYKTIQKNTRILLRTYTDDTALAAAKILTFNGHTYHRNPEHLPQPYTLGYLLAKIWQRDHSDKTSIILDHLTQNPTGLAPILGIPPNRLTREIDRLDSQGILDQRLAVSPAQLIRKWDNPIELLERAYTHDQYR
jgi:hypothetical protein